MKTYRQIVEELDEGILDKIKDTIHHYKTTTADQRAYASFTKKRDKKLADFKKKNPDYKPKDEYKYKNKPATGKSSSDSTPFDYQQHQNHIDSYD